MKSAWIALPLLGAAVSYGCSDREQLPFPSISLTSQQIDAQCEVRLLFPRGALQVYVSDPSLTTPRSNSVPDDGVLYFGVGTTEFPEGLTGELRYGQTQIARGEVVQRPSTGPATDLPYPLPVQGASGMPSLLNVRQGCGPGDGGCFKVGVATLRGNLELRVDDFSCTAEEQTWTASGYVDPPENDAGL